MTPIDGSGIRTGAMDVVFQFICGVPWRVVVLLLVVPLAGLFAAAFRTIVANWPRRRCR